MIGSTFESIKRNNFGAETERVKRICDAADEIITMDSAVDGDESVDVSHLDCSSGQLKLTFHGYDFDPFFIADQADFLASQASKIIFKGGDKVQIDAYFKFNPSSKECE